MQPEIAHYRNISMGQSSADSMYTIRIKTLDLTFCYCCGDGVDLRGTRQRPISCRVNKYHIKDLFCKNCEFVCEYCLTQSCLLCVSECIKCNKIVCETCLPERTVMGSVAIKGICLECAKKDGLKKCHRCKRMRPTMPCSACNLNHCAPCLYMCRFCDSVFDEFCGSHCEECGPICSSHGPEHQCVVV